MLAFGFSAQICNILAAEKNFAGGRGLHIHDCFQQSCLSTARLADNSDGLAFFYANIYIIARRKVFSAAHSKFFRQILYAHDNFRHTDASPFRARLPAKIWCTRAEDFL